MGGGLKQGKLCSLSDNGASNSENRVAVFEKKDTCMGTDTEAGAGAEAGRHVTESEIGTARLHVCSYMSA